MGLTSMQRKDFERKWVNLSYTWVADNWKLPQKKTGQWSVLSWTIFSSNPSGLGESSQDDGERLWAHLLSQAHQNHNYLQNNHQWKRLEPTRKDLLQHKEGTTMRRQEEQTRKVIKSHPLPPRWATHALESNYIAEVLPQEREFWAPRQAPQPGGPAPGRRAPRAFGFEGQRGFIAGAHRTEGNRDFTLKGTHKIPGQKQSFDRSLGQTYLLVWESPLERRVAVPRDTFIHVNMAAACWPRQHRYRTWSHPTAYRRRSWEASGPNK